MKPIFDAVAKNYADDIKFLKVNVGQEPGLASRDGIQGRPVIKFFYEGKEVGEIVGYIPHDTLTRDRKDI